MVQMFSVVSNQLIKLKLVKSHSIMTDFQFLLMNDIFSIFTHDSIKASGRFRIQLLLGNNTETTGYNNPKNDRYCNSPTQWTKLSLIFTVENYGNKLIYDWIDSAHADMCFSINTITHSVY